MKFLKDYWIAVAVIIIIIIAAVLFNNKNGQTENTQTTDQQSTSNQQEASTTEPSSNQNTPSKSSTPQSTSTGQSTSSVWEGQLEKSDNLAKGNLMLKMSDHTVYLHTSRDFSSLIGKHVSVSYNGSLDNFTLGNITAK